MTLLAWVVGSGGMLGGALAAHARGCDAEVFDAGPVRWSDPVAAQRILAVDAARFAERAGTRPWLLLWAAGASVVATGTEGTADEIAALRALLAAVAARRPAGPGAMFVTSSAGGVYAGSAGAPFTVTTPPQPVSPYGALKLQQEQAARELLGGRIPLVLGRFSNLYGPGHSLAKDQGLIPLLCRASVRREPLNLYVSMDTVRDYLYVDDAAALAWQATTGAVGEDPPEVHVEVIASGRAASVAEVVASIQGVTHRRVPLALGSHPSARHQVRDLRLVPSLHPGSSPLTPLPTGIRRIFDASVGRPA